jgi:hypothetical protein
MYGNRYLKKKTAFVEVTFYRMLNNTVAAMPKYSFSFLFDSLWS